MALERVLPSLVAVGEVLDGHPALDAREGVARGVGEALEAARLVLQRRLAVLERRAQVARVEEDDVPVTRAHHELRVRRAEGQVQREDLPRHLGRRDPAGRRARVPAPHGPVPRPAEDDVVLRVVLQAADAGVVGAERRGLAPLERAVDARDAHAAVDAADDGRRVVAGERRREAGRRLRRRGDERPVPVQIVAPDRRVPGRREEHVRARRAELDARDAVLGRVREVE
mmetsp:Transcript_17684/g.46419  ORF Transcript_17684/g.46419 Transcript_17684/m.46419 type:complete len:228 (+) Transcript_17684:358-1041(+)